MNITRTKEIMETKKTVETATLTLELYDTKFVMTSDDLESGDWIVEISFPSSPEIKPRHWEYENEWFTDEGEMRTFLWDIVVLEFLKKYHRGADVSLAIIEIESEDED